MTKLTLILTLNDPRKKKIKCRLWVGLEPGTSKTLMTANVLTTSAIGAVWYWCITNHSLSKLDCCFNDVSAGPL